jgi:hypothetical protein
VSVGSRKQLNEPGQNVQSNHHLNVLPFPFGLRDTAKLSEKNHCPQMIISHIGEKELFQGCFVGRKLRR